MRAHVTGEVVSDEEDQENTQRTSQNCSYSYLALMGNGSDDGSHEARRDHCPEEGRYRHESEHESVVARQPENLVPELALYSNLRMQHEQQIRLLIMQ